SDEEIKQLLVEFNDTAADYPRNKTIHQLFEEQVERTPDNISTVGSGQWADSNTRPVDSWQLAVGKEKIKDKKEIKDNEETKEQTPQIGLAPDVRGIHESPFQQTQQTIQITYRELNKKSNQLACRLEEKGVRANTIVGIMLKPSLEMIVGIMGILKAGGAYLPVDPIYPRERKNYMLADSSAKLILVAGNTEPEIEICETLDVGNSEIYKKEAGNPEKTSTVNELIYTIYTSGTTGRPKGAGVFHKGFTNLVNWYVNEFEFKINDNVLVVTSAGFDLTQKNFFAPLIGGGTLLIPFYRYFDPQLLLQEIHTKKITRINCTPGMFNQLVQDQNQLHKLATLKSVFLGGEPLAVKKLLKWMESEYYNAQVVNTYGPTECTDVCTYYRLPRIHREGVGRPGEITQSVPIGRPID
ncbi:MAG: amino acid adenylation domain-containing protein, partial [bacterium]|nr:amino acid adenylation domain-containing protein [bacterium]